MHNDPSAPGQQDWRWCHKCQGLFFSGGNELVGACPAGDQHEKGRSGNYTLVHNDPSAPGHRTGDGVISVRGCFSLEDMNW